MRADTDWSNFVAKSNAYASKDHCLTCVKYLLL